ncbi:hypothetical protein [Arthrobacter sp. MP_2.3]|uniref:hypothetical protein n=1 Tax=Arthrobacter sp. MP_2.3 TaxID=3349633 RepID=UPI0038D42B94
MSNRVEVSPGGIGFIRTTAKKSIPDAPLVLKTARRRPWLLRRDVIETRYTKASSGTGTRKQH